MAWQGPAFGIRHVLREVEAVDVSGISISTGGAAAGYGLEFAYDNSAGTIFRSAASGALSIDIDRDGTAIAGIDALLIPAGHNLDDTVTVLVVEDGNASFSSPTTVGTGSPTDYRIPFFLSLTESSERYMRISLSESTFTPAYYEIPQLIFTGMTRPTIAESAGRWGTAKAYRVDTLLEGGATARVNHSPPLRTWEYEFPYVTDADEIAALDLVAETSPHTPIVFEHPYSTDATGTAQPAITARITHSERRLFRPAPGDLAASYRFTFSEFAG